MPYESETSHKVETMAWAGKVPWHGLGVEVSNDLTPRQMMEKAGLDWSVVKVPTYMKWAGGEIPTGMEALVRSSDGKMLTQVGENWHPVQNEEAFEFFSEYVLAGGMEMNTAGSLKGGRMTWGLAKIKESFDVLAGGGDRVDAYLLFSNPHEYGKSIDIRFTPIRVVCNNTLTFALASIKNKGVRLSHRREFNADMVKEHLGIASEKFSQYRETAEFLASRKFTVASLIGYYNEVFPRTTHQGGKEAPRPGTDYNGLTVNAKKAHDALETQPGAEHARGTWWQALNSVTYITDHELGRENDSRLTSAWFGANQNRKIKAVEKAVEYAMADQ